MMKNVQSPKMTYLLKFSAEIWTLSGPIMSIQNLLIFHWVFQFRPSPKLLESVVCHRLQQGAHFWQVDVFRLLFPNISLHPIISQIHVFVM